MNWHASVLGLEVSRVRHNGGDDDGGDAVSMNLILMNCNFHLKTSTTRAYAVFAVFQRFGKRTGRFSYTVCPNQTLAVNTTLFF